MRQLPGALTRGFISNRTIGAKNCPCLYREAGCVALWMSGRAALPMFQQYGTISSSREGLDFAGVTSRRFLRASQAQSTVVHDTIQATICATGSVAERECKSDEAF